MLSEASAAGRTAAEAEGKFQLPSNFNSRQIQDREPYIFQSAKLVFFVDDVVSPGWKVRIEKEPCSRRVITGLTDVLIGVPGRANAVDDVAKLKKVWICPHR